MTLFFRALTLGLWLGALLCLVQCASQEKSANTPDGLFNAAEQEFKDENYTFALEKFRAVKNRFPYSSKAVEAELRIADSYFAQESYIEAEGAYEVFSELHPNHSKADYVQYRVGLSNFHQIPGNIARDLTAAHKAVDAFNTFFRRFPKSRYREEAQKHSDKANQRLAEHERYVANFYFQRQHYLSSSYRYASLLRKYPELGYNEEALYRLGECYYHIRMFDNARDALNRLLEKYPQSDFHADASSLLNRLKEKND